MVICECQERMEKDCLTMFWMCDCGKKLAHVDVVDYGGAISHYSIIQHEKEITRKTKEALVERGIDLNLILLAGLFPIFRGMAPAAK